MTDSTTLPRRVRALRAASILPAVALLVLAGCASPDSGAGDVDSTPPADSAADPNDGGAGESPADEPEEDAEEPAEPADDGEVVIEGADLVTDTFVLVGAETYAEGREPVPTVTFTGPLSVTFTFATTLDEAAKIGNCQIAYGVLDASGVDITIVDEAGTMDCTALVEG